MLSRFDENCGGVQAPWPSTSLCSGADEGVRSYSGPLSIKLSSLRPLTRL